MNFHFQSFDKKWEINVLDMGCLPKDKGPMLDVIPLKKQK